MVPSRVIAARTLLASGKGLNEEFVVNRDRSLCRSGIFGEFEWLDLSERKKKKKIT